MSEPTADVHRDEALRRSAHAEVVQALAPVVQQHLAFLKAVETAWQPSDCLPDFSSDGWPEQLSELRRHALAIPDDLLVVLVGDMVTEEALPSYSMALNTIVEDREGTSPAPWARWLRGWTAEENRHGDLLNAYLRLGGRVGMKAVEQTVQWLIANGFNAESADDPYHLLVYTSFQERATRISHGNVGRLAAEAGDPTLARICRLIASDEARHEAFYTRMMAQVLEIDPSGGVLAFHRMLQRQIAMPGRSMTDGTDPDLFAHFAVVAQRTGVYTALDYAAIVEHLVSAWNIAGRSVSGEAAWAQDDLCRAAPRYARLAERVASSARRQPPVSFAWIHGRQA
jgi:acyl-[acyl-carrier-protein] desaturase